MSREDRVLYVIAPDEDTAVEKLHGAPACFATAAYARLYAKHRHYLRVFKVTLDVVEVPLEEPAK